MLEICEFKKNNFGEKIDLFFNNLKMWKIEFVKMNDCTQAKKIIILIIFQLTPIFPFLKYSTDKGAPFNLYL